MEFQLIISSFLLFSFEINSDKSTVSGNTMDCRRKCASSRDCFDSGTICMSTDGQRPLAASEDEEDSELGVCVCHYEVSVPHKIRLPCNSADECTDHFKSQYPEADIDCFPSESCDIPENMKGFCRLARTDAIMSDAPTTDIITC